MKKIEYTHDEIIQFLTDILKYREKIKGANKILIDDVNFYQILDYDKMFSPIEEVKNPSDLLVGSFYDEREFINSQQNGSDSHDVSAAFLPYISVIFLYLFWKGCQEKG